MLKKILNNKLSIVLTGFFVFILALVRNYETALFYDPFLVYFKLEYHNLPLPEINNTKLLFGLFIRYLINTLLSLAIIFTLYKDIDAIKFASVLYFVFFMILLAAFYIILFNDPESNKMGIFYVRRFLIQPLFLLLFVPAFYYQNKKQ